MSECQDLFHANTGFAWSERQNIEIPHLAFFAKTAPSQPDYCATQTNYDEQVKLRDSTEVNTRTPVRKCASQPRNNSGINCAKVSNSVKPLTGLPALVFCTCLQESLSRGVVKE